ncbi:MAG: DUF4340 domain-containing protein [Planctomycetota bacterium]
MNFKTTIVMLVLLAGVAGAYLWVRSSGPAATPTTPKLVPNLVEGREFASITLERGDEKIVLENTRSGWWQTAPVRFPVTGEAIETLINAALALAPREAYTYADDDPLAINTADNLASFGLAPPRAVVTYRSEHGEYRLRLGDITLGGGAYVQPVDSDTVYLVDATLNTAVADADPKTWRPDQLPTLDAARVNRISLSGGPEDITLTRTADGWSLRPDGGERADDATALQLAQIAQQIQPAAYVSDNPAELGRFGLDQPVLTLTTANPAGETQTLRIGQPADLTGQTLYATWTAPTPAPAPAPGNSTGIRSEIIPDSDAASPVVFVLPAAYFKNLNRLTPDTLRDPRVAITPADSVRGQRVNRVGRDTVDLSLNPKDAGPAFVEPQTGYDPDPQRAADWLTTLIHAEPVGFTRSPREAQAPIALVEIRQTGGRVEQLRLYADRDGRDGRDDVLLAVRENEAVAALLPRDQVAPLLAPIVTLRDRQLPDVGLINELRLTRDDGQAFRLLRDSEDNWQPQDEGFEDWEAQRFGLLARWVESPIVEKWTAMTTLPRGPIARLSLGEDRPAYVVNVDQKLGQRTDLPGVFRLPESVATLFAEEYRKRLLLPYRPDQITRVDLGLEPSSDSPSLPRPAAVRLDTQGSYTDAEGERYANQAECASLFSTLAGLRAKRFIPPLLPEQRQTPIKSWHVQTADGQTHRLLRYNQGVWSLGEDRYFYIDVDTDRRLTDKDTEWGQALTLPAAQ